MPGSTLTYERFDAGAEGLREALTSTGNGYFCTRGTVEWEDADGVHYPGTYAHGGFNRETTKVGIKGEKLTVLAEAEGFRGPLRIGVGDEVRGMGPGESDVFAHPAQASSVHP